jgi:hypothetical protein
LHALTHRAGDEDAIQLFGGRSTADYLMGIRMVSPAYVRLIHAVVLAMRDMAMDVEEMMLNEAIRLSLAEHEDRQRSPEQLSVTEGGTQDDHGTATADSPNTSTTSAAHHVDESTSRANDVSQVSDQEQQNSGDASTSSDEAAADEGRSQVDSSNGA